MTYKITLKDCFSLLFLTVFLFSCEKDTFRQEDTNSIQQKEENIAKEEPRGNTHKSSGLRLETITDQQRLVYWYQHSNEKRVSESVSKMITIQVYPGVDEKIIDAFTYAAWILSEVSPNIRFYTPRKIKQKFPYAELSPPPNVISLTPDFKNHFSSSDADTAFWAAFPKSKGMAKSTIAVGNHILTNPFYDYSSIDKVFLTRIAIHELMHSLGFAHVQDEKTFVHAENTPIKRIPIRYYNPEGKTSIMETKIMDFAGEGVDNSETVRLSSSITDLSNIAHNIYYYFKSIDLIAIDWAYGIHETIKTTLNGFAVASKEKVVLEENFDSVIPSTWSTLNLSMPQGERNFEWSNTTGSGSALSDYRVADTSAENPIIDNYLISPMVKLKRGNKIQFSLRGIHQMIHSDRIRLLLLSEKVGEVIPPGLPPLKYYVDWEHVLLDYNSHYFPLSIPTDHYKDFIITLNSQDLGLGDDYAEYRIAFNHYVEAAHENGSGVYFDNIKIIDGLEPTTEYYLDIE